MQVNEDWASALIVGFNNFTIDFFPSLEPQMMARFVKATSSVYSVCYGAIQQHDEELGEALLEGGKEK